MDVLNFHAFVSSSALTEKNKVDFASTPAVPWGRNSMCLICLNWRTALSTSFFYEYISITDRKFKPTLVEVVAPPAHTPPIFRLIKSARREKSVFHLLDFSELPLENSPYRRDASNLFYLCAVIRAGREKCDKYHA